MKYWEHLKQFQILIPLGIKRHHKTKLCVPVITLPINDNLKFLGNIKQGFKITKADDPTFRNINRLFVLLFINGNDDPTRGSSDIYYMPLVEINALIDNKPFFDQPVKNKQEAYKKLIEMSKKW